MTNQVMADDHGGISIFRIYGEAAADAFKGWGSAYKPLPCPLSYWGPLVG